MRKGIIKWVDRAAEKAGVSVVPRWRIEKLAEIDYMKSLFQFLDIKCVIDVGANQGQFRDFLRDDVEFKGHIVSFEPIPAHVKLMRERAVGDPKWHIEECALGSSDGTGTFNVMVGTQFSSFLEPDHSYVSEFKQRNQITEQIEVTIRTLDGAFATLGQRIDARATYLKMDTQGFDLEVLKGARATLSEVRGMQSEASVKPIYSGMPDYVETIKTIQELGFELSGIFPNNAGHFPLLIEFDCYFVASRFARRASGA